MDASSDTKPSSLACGGCTQRDRRIAELEAELANLKSHIERLETTSRAAKRQAAPFSKGSPKPNPKAPGRKSGDDHGIHFHRSAPSRVDETIEVLLPPCCSDPNCSGKPHLIEIVPQFQSEIVRTVVNRQFNVQVGECELCHRRVQGRHPLQTSDALGAAASQIGPEAQSLIVELNKDMGLSYGKIERLMKLAFTLDLSRSGACQVVQRVAERCEPAYQSIIGLVRSSELVVPDETGWRVGGALAWLHLAVGDDATAYLIHPKRGYEASVQLIGADFAGFMNHDGWKPYDRFLLATHQTCLAHLLRRCKELLEKSQGPAAKFPRDVKSILKNALEVRDLRDTGKLPAEAVARKVEALWHQMADLTGGTHVNDDNRRFANHLWNQQESLFTFLQFPGVDATNYKAEQAIRPAVVNRKVWGGNRTEAGARAQSILMSILQTCRQRGMDVLEFLSQTVRSTAGQRPLFLLDTG
jgi:transposase